LTEIILGIGDWGYAKGSHSCIKTYALGSCVAVTLYDPVLKISTMAHIALPDSNHDHLKKANLPGYFADSAMDVMISYMVNNLCNMNRVQIKIFGGARVLKNINVYDVGKKNLEAVFSILEKNKLQISAGDTGSDYSRTVTVFSNDGSVLLSAKGKQFYF